MAGRPGRTNGDKTYVEIVNCDHGDLAIGPIVLTQPLAAPSSTVTMLPTGGEVLLLVLLRMLSFAKFFS